jgi:predicted DNA-binding transcriptional regulator AlpA
VGTEILDKITATTSIVGASTDQCVFAAPAEATSARRPVVRRRRPQGGASAASTPARVSSNTASQPPPLVRWVFKPEVLEITGLSYVTLWQMMREDRFPQSYDIGGKVAWRETDIAEWNATRPVRKLKPLAKEAM